MKQLVEYITGMDCRIGYPNEHVVKAKNENLLIPAMSTGVGLVIHGLEKYSVTPSAENQPMEIPAIERKTTTPSKEKQRETKVSAGFLSRLKEFFDAEEE